MPSYGVKFNNAGEVIVPVWSSGTDLFTVKIKFKTGSTLGTDGLVGDHNQQYSDSYIALFNTGKYRFRFLDGSDYDSPTGLLSTNTIYTLKLERISPTGCNVALYASDGTTVVHSASFNNGAILKFERIGNTGGVGYKLPFNGEIYEVEVTGGTQDRRYLSAVNTGSTWTEILNGQDGALTSLSTNGSQWVSAPNDVVSFSGTIADLEFTAGTTVNLNLRSYFGGNDLPIVASNTGGSLASIGLTLNSDFTITGTTTSGTATAVVITATDDSANTATSNAFNVSVNYGKTRAEIEASDTTSGSNPPFLINDFDVEDLSTDEFSFTIDTQPSSGTLTVNEFSGFSFVDAPNGVYTFTYTGYKNGVSYGTATVTLEVGVSTLNMLDTNTPDGTYSADIYNNSTKTLIETRNITFSSGDASETIPLDTGAEILVFIEGSNPPVTGLAYIEVTE